MEDSEKSENLPEKIVDKSNEEHTNKYFLFHILDIKDFTTRRQILEKCLADVEDVNEPRSQHGETLLVATCKRCVISTYDKFEYDYDLIDYLLEAGIDPNIPDKDKKTALESVCELMQNLHDKKTIDIPTMPDVKKLHDLMVKLVGLLPKEYPSLVPCTVLFEFALRHSFPLDIIDVIMRSYRTIMFGTVFCLFYTLLGNSPDEKNRTEIEMAISAYIEILVSDKFFEDNFFVLSTKDDDTKDDDTKDDTDELNSCSDEKQKIIINATVDKKLNEDVLKMVRILPMVDRKLMVFVPDWISKTKNLEYGLELFKSFKKFQFVLISGLDKISQTDTDVKTIVIARYNSLVGLILDECVKNKLEYDTFKKVYNCLRDLYGHETMKKGVKLMTQNSDKYGRDVGIFLRAISKVNEISKLTVNDMCPICYQEGLSHIISNPKCGHSFACESCYVDLMIMAPIKGRNECPVCRVELSMDLLKVPTNILDNDCPQ